MWSVNNDSPFEAKSSLVCDRNGASQWVVAIKGTYRLLRDGRVALANRDEQAPIHESPRHRGDPLTTSLAGECELDYVRQHTDVLLHGSAYAPGGRPVAELDVTLMVAGMTKTLRVFGDRRWRRGVTGPEIGSIGPFVVMPIVYERAYGGSEAGGDTPGFEPRNPVGAGYASTARRALGQPIPNIEYPGGLIGSWRDRPCPAGFGPIARHWLPRRQLAGTYDAAWERDRLPLLPLDFDERFYQCAPADQQAQGYLRGGEPVLLRNLSPQGEWRLHLPAETFVLRTRMGGRWHERRPDLHQVELRPDDCKLMMLWKSTLPCHADRLTLECTTIQHKPRVRAIAEAAR
ncbi:MAG: DUF2169 domain-containing protein [Proteobacteria bacterium]|nr:DUF2169 domain-containing protein [Pseudomonadota bacterium]